MAETLHQTGMRILPDLAKMPEWIALCELLLQAEGVSMRCSARQASLAGDVRLARLLGAQSRHEAGHVALFQAVLRSAPARYRAGLRQPLAALLAYERRLDDALCRGDLSLSLIGLQVVLEGIGIELLRRFDGAPALRPLRRVLLHQEQRHHRLGLSLLNSPGTTQFSSGAEQFVCAGQDLLHASRSLLEHVGLSTEGIDPALALRA